MLSMKSLLRQIRDYWVIRRSGMFDHQYYLRNNLDVARGCKDPIWHYVRNGWREGRNPNKNFDTRKYLKDNANFVAQNVNPFYHYINIDRGKNRVEPIVRDEPTSQHIKRARELASLYGKKFSIIMPTWNCRNPIKILN